METEYQRAWRERGEAEAALREWRNNQNNPPFMKTLAIFGGVMGALMVGTAAEEWNGTSIPIGMLGLFFMSMLFVVPSVLRDQERRREAALETLRRLGITVD